MLRPRANSLRPLSTSLVGLLDPRPSHVGRTCRREMSPPDPDVRSISQVSVVKIGTVVVCVYGGVFDVSGRDWLRDVRGGGEER